MFTNDHCHVGMKTTVFKKRTFLKTILSFSFFCRSFKNEIVNIPTYLSFNLDGIEQDEISNMLQETLDEEQLTSAASPASFWVRTGIRGWTR